MSAQMLITVGTDKIWGPPQMVDMDFYGDFTVRNIETAQWRIEGDGIVARMAVRTRGSWYAYEIDYLSVERGDTLYFPAGSLTITIDPSGIPVNIDLREIESPRKRIETPRKRIGHVRRLLTRGAA